MDETAFNGSETKYAFSYKTFNMTSIKQLMRGEEYPYRVLDEVLEVLAVCHLYFSKVLAARKKNLTTARAHKNKHTARMLAKTI